MCVYVCMYVWGGVNDGPYMCAVKSVVENFIRDPPVLIGLGPTAQVCHGYMSVWGYGCVV